MTSITPGSGYTATEDGLLEADRRRTRRRRVRRRRDDETAQLPQDNVEAAAGFAHDEDDSVFDPDPPVQPAQPTNRRRRRRRRRQQQPPAAATKVGYDEKPSELRLSETSEEDLLEADSMEAIAEHYASCKPSFDYDVLPPADYDHQIRPNYQDRSKVSTPVDTETRRRRLQFNESVTRYVFSKPADSPAFLKKWVNIDASVWLVAALALLTVSNIIFMTAFVTNSWGIMLVYTEPRSAPGDPDDGPAASRAASEKLSGGRPVKNGDDVVVIRPSRVWNFGLWRCCRDDGVCLGARWPAFYGTTRIFGVLGLFGHALALAWILGHTVERLLAYDPCTMMSLVSACFITTAFVLIAVCVYGAMWPSEFRRLFSESMPLYDAATTLGYSYYLAVTTVPLCAAAGICVAVDFYATSKDLELERRFSGYDSDSDDDDVDNNDESRRSESDSGVPDPLSDLFRQRLHTFDSARTLSHDETFV